MNPRKPRKTRKAETVVRELRGSDADPAQQVCSQCGKSFMGPACGFTHAAVGSHRMAERRRSLKNKETAR